MDAEPKATGTIPPPNADPVEEKPKRSRKSTRPKGRPLALETELEEFFTMMGAMVMMVDQFDGLVITSQAEDNAKALAKLANKNARVKKALEAMMQVSSLGAIAGVVGATAVPILMHHGVIPPALPMPEEWLEPPERLEFKAQMKAKMEAQGGGDNGANPGG